MPGRPTPTHKELIQTRRTEAMRLKLRGWSLLDIGYRLHADPAHNTATTSTGDPLYPDGYPQGYGLDAYTNGGPPLKPKSLAELVSQDLLRARRHRDQEFTEHVNALRGLQAERYENLMRDLLTEYDRAGASEDFDYLEPDERVRLESAAREFRHKARGQLVQILTRLDTIHGVARPVRSEVSGPDGGPIEVAQVSLAELENLINTVGDDTTREDPTPGGAEDRGGHDEEG